MNKFVFIIYGPIFFLFNIYSQNTPALNPTKFKLIYEDNFTELDLNLYDLAWNWGNCGVGGDSNSCFKTDLSNHEITADGNLKLWFKEEPYFGTIYSWDENGVLSTESKYFDYTKAMIISKDKFKYGYFEIRYRMPTVGSGKSLTGIGPNFWLWHAGEVNSCGLLNNWSEIDVFEHRGDINNHTCNVHYQEVVDTTKYDGQMYYYGGTNYQSNNWIVAGVNWTPEKIEFYQNNTLIGVFPKQAAINIPTNLIAMSVIIDIASTIGNYLIPISDDTQLPYYFEVDYLKIYKHIKDFNLREKVFLIDDEIEEQKEWFYTPGLPLFYPYCENRDKYIGDYCSYSLNVANTKFKNNYKVLDFWNLKNNIDVNEFYLAAGNEINIEPNTEIEYGVNMTIEIENFDVKSPIDVSRSAFDYYMPKYDYDKEKEDKGLELKIYPNPIEDDEFTIQSSKVIERITVVDLLGKPLKTFDVNTDFKNISVDWLPAGLYLLQVEFKDETKVIKIKKN